MVVFAASCSFVLRHEGCEERENKMESDMDVPEHRRRLVLPELVDGQSRLDDAVYRHNDIRFRMPDVRRRMDEPSAEEQYDVRPLQRGK